MPNRPAALAGVLVTTALMLLLVAAPSASAGSPWWQVLTGSRPTNLWEPTDNVQEIKTSLGGELGTVLLVSVHGENIGCLGQGTAGLFFCQGFSPIETAAQLEALLEPAFGTTAVDVSGGPLGGEPFLVTTPGRPAPAVGVTAPLGGLAGSATASVLSVGGSGRLVLTLTNLGNEPVEGSKVPVIIRDELPDGVEATGAEGFAGYRAEAGPVECSVADPTEVECKFEGQLPPYEAIEVEIEVSLVGQPPQAGEAGAITVTGGKAVSASAPQTIEVNSEPTRFGIEKFSTAPENEGGTPSTQAGGHPYQLTTTIQPTSGFLRPGPRRDLNVIEQPGMPRNLRFALPPGLVGNASALPQCTMERFLSGGPNSLTSDCTGESAIGVASVTVSENTPTSGAGLGFVRLPVPVFNLVPAPGEPARFGFVAIGDPVVIGTSVDPENGYRINASVKNTTQLIAFLSSTLSLWGAPGDSAHDGSRGWACVRDEPDLFGPCERSAGLPENAFLRDPVACQRPLEFGAEMEPWNVPLGSEVAAALSTSPAMQGCNNVPFDPAIEARSTGRLAQSPTGLDFRLDMPNSGLDNPAGIAEGQAKKVEVTLPEGMTINPSQGEGLATCSPAEYAEERFDSAPGKGCPEASKVGTVTVQTPLLKEEAQGSLYVAQPYDNPFGSLLALYLVAKIPERGVLIKQAGKVVPDPKTGQLVTTFDDLPQVPFSSFKLHFREGGRAPLVTPPSCGSYDVVARFTPWSVADPDNPEPTEIVTRTSSFVVERGVDGGACPSGGMPPFKPGLVAGSINSAAGQFSPFNVRLTRNDGEQEFTNFSIKLPPGVIGKLAGIPFCSDAAIALAKSRTGSTGGQEELTAPSCPAASQVGRTLVGAGVGSILTYVPGKLYLAGPYHGSALSIVSITAAKVGPFDLGTVVVREALKVNPDTAEVFVDATGSDPIPHIIQGIPVHAHDIRIYVDRPDFVLNPTSCERTSTASTVLGSGLDFGSAADDQPVTVTSPFQAADCASLGFKPRLSLRLNGGTKRGSTPAFEAVLRARPGDANIGEAQVTLPHSEFLEQSHIRTICTRVQFAAGDVPGEKCPAGSIYGYAKAITPLLDEPIAGPVFLRSSPRKLPDLVAALHSGRINVNVVGFIDSVKGGRIRNTFKTVPDAPVTKFVLKMQGGQKGLLVNSTNICKGAHRAIANFVGHNGRAYLFNPALKATSCHTGKGKRAHRGT